MPKPGNTFKPGIWRMEIEFETQEAVFVAEQEFAWGVLAINTNKSIYVNSPLSTTNINTNDHEISATSSDISDTSFVSKEVAYMQMAALKNDGHTICDANLELEIVSPGGLGTYPEVQKSGRCGPNNVIDVPDYSNEEKDYIGNLQKRLESAKLARSKQFEEFDNLSLDQYYDANERAANTTIKAKKNRADIIYQSGTLRTKMMAFLSSFQGLNLKPDITAFNKTEIPINTLGDAMEDIIDKTEEMEMDEEQKMLRQYELLKHGTVFVEELWEEKWNVEKKISKGFYGMIKGVAWNAKKVLGIGQPRRRIIPLKSVYLGDLTEYDNSEQPYQFTVKKTVIPIQ